MTVLFATTNPAKIKAYADELKKLGYDYERYNKFRNKYFVFDSGKGVYSIRTYNTEACVGMLSEIEVFEHMEVDINSSACAIALSVLDNKKFYEGLDKQRYGCYNKEEEKPRRSPQC